MRSFFFIPWAVATTIPYESRRLCGWEYLIIIIIDILEWPKQWKTIARSTVLGGGDND